MINSRYGDAQFEKIEVLPEWVKSFLLKYGGMQSQGSKDAYGRTSRKSFGGGGFMKV